MTLVVVGIGGLLALALAGLGGYLYLDGRAEQGLSETVANYERPTKEESTAGRWLGKLIATIPKPLLGLRGTLFKRMAVKSIHNYYKTISGADAIAINAKAGQRLDFEPVAFRPPDECEDDEAPGWYAKDRDKVWSPSSEGNSVNFLNGKTPAILLEDDDHVEAGTLAPRIGEAIELDNYWPLFTNNEINATLKPQVGNGANPARADGGAAAGGEIELTLEQVGEWAGDNVVDLDSGEGYSGMRISTDKAREWRAEHADSEAMKRAEDRGRLMEALSDDQRDAARIFLYAVLLVLGFEAIVRLGPQLVGGGGGGGINPLTIMPLLGL